MRLLISNVYDNKQFEASGTEIEVERVLRSHFPGAAKGVDLGDLGGLVHEVERLPYVVLQILEGPVPSPQPVVDGIIYGMHRGDDPWPREADVPRQPGEPEPKLQPYEEPWDEAID